VASFKKGSAISGQLSAYGGCKKLIADR
jgi:hypothetical protein